VFGGTKVSQKVRMDPPLKTKGGAPEKAESRFLVVRPGRTPRNDSAERFFGPTFLRRQKPTGFCLGPALRMTIPVWRESSSAAGKHRSENGPTLDSF
jgi:hypothetical protein